MLKLSPEEREHLFSSSGHYSPAMNAWVADRIAGFLKHEETEGSFPPLPAKD